MRASAVLLSVLFSIVLLSKTIAGAAPALKTPTKVAGDPVKLVQEAAKIVIQSKGEEAEDYCQFETNYIYKALSILTKAADLNVSKTMAALDAIKDPHFLKFKTSPEFRKFQISLRPLPTTPAETSEYLARHNEWLTQGSIAPPNFVTFETSNKITFQRNSGPDQKPQIFSWKTIGKNQIEVSPKRRFELKIEKHFFDSGQQSFRFVALSELGGTEELWPMGPLTGDCN